MLVPYADDIRENVGEVPAIVAEAVTPSCDAPSKSAVAATETTLYGPMPEARAEIQAVPQTSYTVMANEARDLTERRAVARDLGLTMHNANPTLGQLDQLQRYHDPSELAKVAMPFLEEYGITDVDLATKEDLFEDTWKPIEESEYRFERNINIMTLVKTLGSLPEEYVKMTGITRVAFAKSKPKDDSLAFVVSSKDNETANTTMVLNSSKFIGEDTYKHELFHKIDALVCGSGKRATNDPTFAGLTNVQAAPHNQSYPYKPAPLTLNEYNVAVARASLSINRKSTACADEVLAAQNQLAQEASRTVFASEYARSGGVVEAKAELFEEDSDYISPRLGNLRKQLVVLLARLYERDTRLGTFMSTFYRDRFEPVSIYLSQEPALSDCDYPLIPGDPSITTPAPLASDTLPKTPSMH